MTYWPKPPYPKPAKKTRRAPTRVATHVFLNAGQTDHAGVGICAECGHLKTSPVHDLTVVSPEVEAIERRRIGEGATDD